jgi:hypothetical protein
MQAYAADLPRQDRKAAVAQQVAADCLFDIRSGPIGLVGVVDSVVAARAIVLNTVDAVIVMMVVMTCMRMSADQRGQREDERQRCSEKLPRDAISSVPLHRCQNSLRVGEGMLCSPTKIKWRVLCVAPQLAVRRRFNEVPS